MGEKILPHFREKVKRFFEKFTKSTQFLKTVHRLKQPFTCQDLDTFCYLFVI